MNEFIVPTEPPPHAIAFVIDGVVEEVIYTHDRFAAINLSQPLIVYATGVHPIVGKTTYDANTKEFHNPNGSVEIAEEFEIKKF
jgi:hypothetical protein